MNITLILFLIFYQTSIWAQISITPLKPGPHKLGDVIEAQLELKDKDLLQKLSPVSLQKSNIPQSLWFMHVDPWQLSETRMITQATVVLGPEINTDNETIITVAEVPVSITFDGWNVEKAGNQQPQPLLYEELPWYQRAWWEKNKLLISLIVVSGAVLIFFIIKTIFRNNAQRRLIQKQRQEVIEELLQANSLGPISNIWLKREKVFVLFPDKEINLRTFFDTLNKFQFKPSPTQEELASVLHAKKKLVEELRQVSNGV